MTHASKRLSVSLAILTHNGGDILCSLLKSLRTQILDADLELVCLDSGSNDIPDVSLFGHSAYVYSIPEYSFRFGTARQLLFCLTRGDIIVTLSQDVLPINDHFLADLIAPILAGDADVVGGVTDCPNNDAYFYWDRRGAFYFTREGTDFFRWSDNAELSCVLLAITRLSWSRTGFGGVPFCEDKWLQRKLVAMSYRIVMKEEALAWHGHRYDLGSLTRRCVNEGVGWWSIGVAYTLWDLVRDLAWGPWKHVADMWKGIVSGQARSLHALLFFQIRPMSLYLGNRFVRRYWPPRAPGGWKIWA